MPRVRRLQSGGLLESDLLAMAVTDQKCHSCLQLYEKAGRDEDKVAGAFHHHLRREAAGKGETNEGAAAGVLDGDKGLCGRGEVFCQSMIGSGYH